MFRRFKIAELSANGEDGSLAFRQEYPMSAAEAFLVSGGDTLIQPIEVSTARANKCLGSGPLIVGVGPRTLWR